jgi:hypothetical protein
MKTLLAVVVCVGFAAGSVFAGTCEDKKKDGEKKECPKEGASLVLSF